MKSPEQLQTSVVEVAPLEQAEFAAHVRILPEPIYGGDEDAEATNSCLLAFDPLEHPALKEPDFTEEIERTLGFHCDTNQEEVTVRLAWVDGNRLLEPFSKEPGDFEKITAIQNDKLPGQIGGYYGIRLVKAGVDEIDTETAAVLAALIAERYEGDSTPRALYNYTSEEPTDPIQISGPDYNLAEQTTGENPTIDLERIAKRHSRVKLKQIAPQLARVSLRPLATDRILAHL